MPMPHNPLDRPYEWGHDGLQQLDPLEVVKRLDHELAQRRVSLDTWNDYYSGDHELLFATEKFRKAFGGLFAEFSDNWCSTVVNAVDERISVTGFRVGAQTGADQKAWDIWLENHMDAQSKLGVKSALIDSTAYIMVWPDFSGYPKMTVESAYQMICLKDCGCVDENIAALKRWNDDWSGAEMATLYTNTAIYKYIEADNVGADKNTVDHRYTPITSYVDGSVGRTWVPRLVPNEPWPLPNPYGVVPVFELPNDPRLTLAPRSEIEAVIPLQNAINKLVTDMIVASEFGAFRQKWAIGVEIPVDPDTNQPIEPWRMAVERILTVPPSDEITPTETPRFGEFGQTDLTIFVKAVDMLVSHLASQTRTPPHYLSTSADRLSGESIKSAETGLVAKAKDKMLHFHSPIEEAMRLAFRIMGDERGDGRIEVIWADPETRSEAAHIDALGKERIMLKVPLEQLWEDAGYSPVEIDRFKDMLLEEQKWLAPITPNAATAQQEPLDVTAATKASGAAKLERQTTNDGSPHTNQLTQSNPPAATAGT